jgi:voltage-gated potassium channel
MLSMNWAIQTITSVGYGDTDIVNNYGRMIGSIIMLAGLILFTVANASLMTIAADLDESGEYHDKVDVLI